jgi:hypothetical protein
MVTDENADPLLFIWHRLGPKTPTSNLEHVWSATNIPGTLPTVARRKSFVRKTVHPVAAAVATCIASGTLMPGVNARSVAAEIKIASLMSEIVNVDPVMRRLRYAISRVLFRVRSGTTRNSAIVRALVTAESSPRSNRFSNVTRFGKEAGHSAA